MTWSAKITLNGAVYNYSQDSTSDGPHLPGYKVYFRPDEIFFHWGTARDKTVKPVNLDPYVAEVSKDGVVVATYNIGGDGERLHWWASRWYHEITPDTIVRTPADLMAQFLVPPFGDMGVKPSNVVDRVFEGPMGTAGLTTYEPETGERGEIGIANEWAAKFLRTGNATSMIEVGKAAFSMPMFWTDETTGKPFDLVANPHANTYSTNAQGGPWMGPWAPKSTPPNPWALDSAHGMEDEAIIYFATGLDRHLEALQYRAVAMFMADALHSYDYGYAVSAPSQTRGTGWMNRQLAYATRATQLREQQGPLPDYLLSYAQLKQVMDNQAAYFRKVYLGAPNFQSLHIWPDGRAPFWQQDYLNTAFALPAMWWPEIWGDVYRWTLYNVIQRTNGKSGFPPAIPYWYYGNIYADYPTNKVTFPDFGTMWQDWAVNQIAGTDKSGNNGWLTQAQYDTLKADQYNGGRFIKPHPYALNVRGALAFAVYLDRNKIVDVSTTYPELEQCFAVQDAMIKAYGYMVERWSLAVAPQPVTVITIGPTNPENPVANLATPITADPSLFDAAGALNLSTDQDAVLVDLTGHIPSGSHQLLFNIQGNGNTEVHVTWPGEGASYIKPVSTATPKGGKAWQDTHGSGDKFVLYNCGTSIIVNGAQIGTPQTPPPSTDPTQPQEPTVTDVLQPIKDEVSAIETSVTNLLTRLATIAANATTAGTQIDPAEITAIVAEMQNNIQAKIDAAAPTS